MHADRHQVHLCPRGAQERLANNGAGYVQPRYFGLQVGMEYQQVPGDRPDERFLYHYSMPQKVSLRTDNGSQFEAGLFREYLEEMSIDHEFTTWPTHKRTATSSPTTPSWRALSVLSINLKPPGGERGVQPHHQLPQPWQVSRELRYVVSEQVPAGTAASSRSENDPAERRDDCY